MTALFSFLTPLFLGMALFPVFIKLLHVLQLSDDPGGRKLHAQATPAMGGLLIFFSAFISVLIWGKIDLEGRFIWSVIALLLILGFRDDFSDISAKIKLWIQLLAVTVLIGFADIRIEHLHGLFGMGELSYWASVTFSGFVLLVLINSFNLIDGMDGLAGTYALFVLFFVSLFFLGFEEHRFLILSLATAGSIVAFLVYNWHPAKVFMGDTGSLPMGVLLGTFLLELMSAEGLNEILGIKPVFSLGISLFIFPLLDMARVFVKRIRKGKHPLHPDKSHIHHFLLRMGFTPPQVITLVLIFNLICIFLVMSLRSFSDEVVLGVLTGFSVLTWGILDSMAKKWVKKHAKSTPRILERRRLERMKIELRERSQHLDSGTMNLN